jgi:predicted nucleic acid-binding protein
VLVYLDSELVIYLIEQNPQYAPAVEAWLTANPAARLASSELVRMETLVLPTRRADAARIVDFNCFFATQVSVMIPLDRTVFEKAIEIRAAYPSFRTPDAIHLAAATTFGCDLFLTNDAQLVHYRGIPVSMV